MQKTLVIACAVLMGTMPLAGCKLPTRHKATEAEQAEAKTKHDAYLTAKGKFDVTKGVFVNDRYLLEGGDYSELTEVLEKTRVLSGRGALQLAQTLFVNGLPGTGTGCILDRSGIRVSDASGNEEGDVKPGRKIYNVQAAYTCSSEDAPVSYAISASLCDARASQPGDYVGDMCYGTSVSITTSQGGYTSLAYSAKPYDQFQRYTGTYSGPTISVGGDGDVSASDVEAYKIAIATMQSIFTQTPEMADAVHGAGTAPVVVNDWTLEPSAELTSRLVAALHTVPAPH